MQAGSVRGYLDLAGHQAEAVPQRLGYNQPPCLIYGRAHATKIPCAWQVWRAPDPGAGARATGRPGRGALSPSPRDGDGVEGRAGPAVGVPVARHVDALVMSQQIFG